MYEAVKLKLQRKPHVEKARTTGFLHSKACSREQSWQINKEAMHGAGNKAGEMGLPKPFGPQMILS